jgi:hypothetical protein
MPEEYLNIEALSGQGTSLQRVFTSAGHFRSVICGLLFPGLVKNYMDWQAPGALKFG